MELGIYSLKIWDSNFLIGLPKNELLKQAKWTRPFICLCHIFEYKSSKKIDLNSKHEYDFFCVCLLKLISKRWNCIPWVLFFLLSAVTKLSKLTKFECSPSKLCTLFLGFVPVLEAEVVLIKFGDRPLMSNGLGDVVPKKNNNEYD